MAGEFGKDGSLEASVITIALQQKSAPFAADQQGRAPRGQIRVRSTA